MARFKLKENEKLLYEERHDWNTVIHRAKDGIIYVTDKRVVFCATGSGKQLFIEKGWGGDYHKSKNIRWESEHNRIDFTVGRTLLFFKAKYLTLDGKNTKVVDTLYFADGSNADYISPLEKLINKLKNK